MATILAVILTVAFGVWSTFKQLAQAKKDSETRRTNEVKDAQTFRTEAMSDANAMRTQAVADAAQLRIEAVADADLKRSHEIAEAQRSRLLEARRKVYEELVDKFMEAQMAIGGLITADLEDDPTYGLPVQKLAGPVNKTWVLSEVDTAFKARELLTLINEQWFDLLPYTRPMKGQRGLISRIRNKIQELTECINTPPNGPTVNHDRRIADLQSARRQLRQELLSAHYVLREQMNDFMQRMMSHVPAILNQVDVLMFSARTELGITGDTAKLSNQSSEMADRMRAAMVQFQSVIAEMEAMEAAEVLSNA